MKQSRNSKWFLAAIAAASLVSVPAMAQVRANQDGHATDANNRVGSGGYNETTGGSGVSQNQIIYGNVTGGIGFTGPIHDGGEAGQFMGPSAGRSFDNFVRTTAGVPTSYQSQNVASAPQSYYGSSRFVAPPLGTERNGFTGAYLGTGATVSNVDPLTASVTASGDQLRQKLGESDVLGANTKLIKTDPFAGQRQQGVLDATLQASLFTGSPLYGINPLPGSEEANDQNAEVPLFGAPSLAPGGAGRLRGQKSDIDRMRSELLQQNETPNGTSNQPSQNPDQISGLLPAQPLAASPLDNSLTPNTGSPADKAPGNSLKNGINTQQGYNEKFNSTVPGKRPSQSVRALQDRLNQYKSPQLRQLEAYAAIANQRAAINAKANAGGNPTSQPSGGLNGGTPAIGRPATNLPPSNVPAVKVTTLTKGVEAKGLHDLLQSAEDLMRQDKFQSAIARYNTAEDVAPNDALIPLGRANAELGAGYYNQASVDLHQVFQSSPAVLMGQYDLTKWMNDKRVAFIIQELSDLSNLDKSQEMPEFLLAYVLYNTGRPGEAVKHLEEARKRAGDKDPVLNELETRWKTPDADASPGSPDLNK